MAPIVEKVRAQVGRTCRQKRIHGIMEKPMARMDDLMKAVHESRGRFEARRQKLIAFLPELKTKLAEYYGCGEEHFRTFPWFDPTSPGKSYDPTSSLQYRSPLWHTGLAILGAEFHLEAKASSVEVLIRVAGDPSWCRSPQLTNFMDSLYQRLIAYLADNDLPPNVERFQMGQEGAGAGE
jgi:hypothetical protein